MSQIVSIQMLEGAINAARRQSPTRSADHCLSADVAVLAGLYGQLIFHRDSAFDADCLDSATRRILDHWLAHDANAVDGLQRAA